MTYTNPLKNTNYKKWFNLCGPMSIKKIEFVVKNVPVKNMLSPDDSTGKFY